MQKSSLVAVDTNFPLLLAAGDDDATDALEVIRARVRPAQILVPPTALAELLFQSEGDSDDEQRALATRALKNLRSAWHFHCAGIPPEYDVPVRAAAQELLYRGILPAGERNDAKIIAESAVLKSILLVSNDSHLLQIDPRWLVLVFRDFDLPPPLIVSPRDIIRKFYR